MKSVTQQTAFRRTNKLLLTASMLACVTAGWCIGSLTTKVFSDRNQRETSDMDNNIILHSVPINGKALPTILLKEVSVVANRK